jgi:hypothetical protein
MCKMSLSHLLERVGRNLIAFHALYHKFELFLPSSMTSPTPVFTGAVETQPDTPWLGL